MLPDCIESLRAELAVEREETKRWMAEADRVKAEMKRRSIAAVQAVTSLVVARDEAGPEGGRITALEAELASEKEARQRAEADVEELSALLAQRDDPKGTWARLEGIAEKLNDVDDKIAEATKKDRDRLIAIEREARALVFALPRCDHPRCANPATRAWSRGATRLCDEHGQRDGLSPVPEYPRAAPLRALVALFSEVKP